MEKQPQLDKQTNVDKKGEQFQKNLESALVGKKITGIEIRNGNIYVNCENEKGLQIEIVQQDPNDVPYLSVNGMNLDNFEASERYE